MEFDVKFWIKPNIALANFIFGLKVKVHISGEREKRRRRRREEEKKKKKEKGRREVQEKPRYEILVWKKCMEWYGIDV